MKLFFGLAFLVLPLLAEGPLRVAAVDRRGWPPFEDDRRVYRIEGEAASRLRVGEKLALQRSGSSVDPGRLKVATVSTGFAEAYLERRGNTYPLKGDWAEPGQALSLPRIPGIRPEQDLRPVQTRLQPPEEPAAAAIDTPFHPRFLEPVYFLEGDAALSPKGREKLKRLVELWGPAGRWSLGLPEDRTVSDRVREARTQALRRAFRSLGVARVDVGAAEVRPGERGDVVYVAKD